MVINIKPAGLAGLAAVALAACSGTAPAASHSSPSPIASAPVPSGQAGSLQDQFVAVVNAAKPSVVQIQAGHGLGSGIIFDSKGDIVTNDHVVAGSKTFQVTLADGHQYPGTLVGTFHEDDLAVIHVSAPNLHPATFADSSKLQVGDIVMAIGNPLALQSSVTEGIVSALGRTESEPPDPNGAGGTTIPNMVQTSAAINPGNSGGALVDLKGQVIGIPTLAATDQQLGGGAAPGIGFAISGNMAKDIATQLIQHGHVTNSRRAFLGVTIGNIGGSGVFVSSVQAGGPAAKAGVHSGDIISSLNGQATPDVPTLSQILANLQPGQKVQMGITHQDGSKSTVTVTLGTFPGGG
ncbi:MAG: S1C family serine protease [Candidatus Dormibacteraceae bacterium]